MMTIAEAKKEYMKRWRQRNPDKVRQHQERFWACQAERMEAEQSGQVTAAQGPGR